MNIETVQLSRRRVRLLTCMMRETDRIKTARGSIGARAWALAEARRISAGGARAVIAERRGRFAIAVVERRKS